tara:strand:+ start:455 stop:1180 length:726 start_codon:yes stop_codon:yes gene_type:complete
VRPDSFFRCTTRCASSPPGTFSSITTETPKKGLIGQHYSLFDFWSPRSISVERIPFNFTDAPCWFDYSPQRGLDFAVIALPDNTLTLLQQTIVPFTHERWIHQAHVSFDFYALLGIPSCDATQKTSQEGGRNSIVTFPDSRLIRVEAHPNPPNDLLETEFPQFIGRIHPNETIPDVAGTSGGPIFGFRCNDKGQLHYWPVVIQSRWRAQSRTVIGTSIPIVARSIHKWIAGFAQQKCKGPT